jgi:hypothetical protein
MMLPYQFTSVQWGHGNFVQVCFEVWRDINLHQQQIQHHHHCHHQQARNDKNGRHSSAKLGKSLLPSAKGSNNQSSLTQSAQNVEQHENHHTSSQTQGANHISSVRELLSNDQNNQTRGTCWLTFREID